MFFGGEYGHGMGGFVKRAEEPLVTLIANGAFGDTSVWTLDGSGVASITGGKLVLSGAPEDVGTAAQNTLSPLVENLFYQADLVLSGMAGTGVAASAGGGSPSPSLTTNGAHSEFIRAGATQEFLLGGSPDASVDDVALYGPITTALNVELCPDPAFDDAGAWTISGANLSVTGGQLVATGSFGNRSATCLPEGYPLNAGTYDVTFTVVARTAGQARVLVCGVPGTNRNAAGTYNEQIVVAEGDTGTQTIVVSMITSPNLTVDNLSVKKIA